MSVEKYFVIRDGAERFEIAQSRKLKQLAWVAVPTDHDDLAFRRLMATPDGAEIFGVWILLLTVAAKCTPRWILGDRTGPFTPADLELKTGCPAAVISRAIDVLSGNSIGWITTTILPTSSQDSTTVLPASSQFATATYKTGQDETNTTRGKTKSAGQEGGREAYQSPQIPASLMDREFQVAWKRWVAYLQEKTNGHVATPTLASQLDKFEQWGAAAAIKSIEASITNGWLKLVEPKLVEPERSTIEPTPGPRPLTLEELTNWTPVGMKTEASNQGEPICACKQSLTA